MSLELRRARCAWLPAMLVVLGLGMGFVGGRWQATAGTTELAEELFQPSINPVFTGEPLAKRAIHHFDMYLMLQAGFDEPQQKLRNVLQWLEEDFVYETVGFPGAKSAADWCLSGEEQHFRTTFNMSFFTQMLFFGTDSMATTTSYGTVFWAAPLRGIPASKAWTQFRVTDFYLARRSGPGESKLYWNFMMIDFADLLRRNGIHVLPPATLPEGHFRPPAAEDGVPAPLSVLLAGRDASGPERLCREILARDWVGDAVRAGTGGTAPSGHWAEDAIFYGPGGIGMARSNRELERHVLEPFRAAFEERSVATKIFFCEANYCGAFGELRARHVGRWLGLDASSRRVEVRFAFHWRVVAGKVVEGWALFDIPGLFEQLGLDFWKRAAEIAKSQGNDSA